MTVVAPGPRILLVVLVALPLGVAFHGVGGSLPLLSAHYSAEVGPFPSGLATILVAVLFHSSLSQ